MAIQDDHDRDTVEELFRQNYRLMMYIARGILKDQDKAEDAVSQAFIKIIDKLQKLSFENCNKTRGLVVILVKDICYDMLREEKRQNFTPLEEENLPSESEDLSYDHLVLEENYQTLLNALSGLNEKAGSILKLKYIYGYSDKEIGQFLGISPENVRVRLHRAKAALLQVLKEGNTDDE